LKSPAGQDPCADRQPKFWRTGTFTKTNDDPPLASMLVLFCRPKLGANENDRRDLNDHDLHMPRIIAISRFLKGDEIQTMSYLLVRNLEFPEDPNARTDLRILCCERKCAGIGSFFRF